jgi:mannose-6-phosphate isomerase-like protein (cupin superfamily)
MSTPILNVADAAVESGLHGDHFEYSVRPLAEAIGGKAIGANVTTVPPGKAAFPLHHHRANEEHFFILSGTGVLRVGSQAYPVRAHDYIVNLPGAADRAHQLINTGAERPDLPRDLDRRAAGGRRLSRLTENRCADRLHDGPGSPVPRRRRGQAAVRLLGR